MFDKIKQAFELKSKIEQIKKELENSQIEVQANSGQIKIVITGGQKIKSIWLDDSLLVTPNKEQFNKDLCDSINQAIEKSQQLASKKAKEIIGINIPGL